MKRIVAAALVALTCLAPVAGAQTAGGYARAVLVASYDVDSVTYVYPRLVGESQLADTLYSPWNPGIRAPGRVTTNGAQTTEVDAMAGEPPFDALAVGDLIRVSANGRVEERYITSIAGVPGNIEVSPDILIPSAGAEMRYKKQVVSAAAGDAWFSVRDMTQITAQVLLGSLASTSVQARLECRVNSNGLVQPGANIGDEVTLNAANTSTYLPFAATATNWYASNVFDECRVGIKVTADAGNDLVTVLLLGRRR